MLCMANGKSTAIVDSDVKMSPMFFMLFLTNLFVGTCNFVIQINPLINYHEKE